MSEDRTDKLDGMLEEYFRAELEPHAGRAAEAFSGGPPEAGSTMRLPGLQSGRGLRRAAVAAVLAAAGLAIAALVVLGGLGLKETGNTVAIKPGDDRTPERDRPCPTPVEPGTRAVEEPPAVAVEQVMHWRTVDDGMFVHDGTPVRRLRRQQWQTTTWVDTRTGERHESYVPSEEVVLVAVPTY
jgi:hypothetical protein